MNRICDDFIMTGIAFSERVHKDPNWANHPTRKIRVTSFAECDGSPITGIGPNVHFEGCDSDGKSASFCYCEHLAAASGTFNGSVDFSHSGIAEIKDLTIKGADAHGHAADFVGCKHLRAATGTYPGRVDFSESGIEEIKDLTLTDIDSDARAAYFWDCDKLKVATGKFPGAVFFDGSAIEKVKDLEVVPDMQGVYASCYGTPFAKKDPLYTAEILTGSNNPKVWEKLLKEWKLENSHRLEIIKRAIAISKLKGKETALEM